MYVGEAKHYGLNGRNDSTGGFPTYVLAFLPGCYRMLDGFLRYYTISLCKATMYLARNKKLKKGGKK